MTNLSDRFKYYNTSDSDILAEDLRSGKSAYGPTGKIAGSASVVPLDVTNRVLVNYVMPVGQAGAYTASANDAIILDQNATLTGYAGTLTAAGLFNRTGGNTDYMHVSGLSAKQTTIREYTMSGYIGNISGTQFAAPILRFNYIDDNNHWHAAMTWDTANAFRCQIWEITGGSGTERAFQAMSTTLDYPLHYQITVREVDDYVGATFSAYETGTPYTASAYMGYSQASRNHKSETGVKVAAQVESSQLYFRSLIIVDI